MNEPRQPQDKYILRLPDGMRDQIAALAKANGRSMNAEIISRLQASMEMTEFSKRSGRSMPTKEGLRAAIDALGFMLEQVEGMKEGMAVMTIPSAATESVGEVSKKK